MKHFMPALKTLLLLSLLTGVVYPFSVTLVAEVFFPNLANGRDSDLIAQEFKSPRYFASRPSAIGYNPMPSGGSNLGPTSSALKQQIVDRQAAGASTSDMLTASASGLDPHITPSSAYAQMKRVAIARRLNQDQTKKLETLVDQLTEAPTFGILGEQRINVLRLNLEMDRSGL